MSSNRFFPDLSIISAISLESPSKLGLEASRSANPMTGFIGVRISWLARER